VITPNENMVLSSPIPNGFILPSLSKNRLGFIVAIKDISKIKKAVA
jgi:hypothetical protein